MHSFQWPYRELLQQIDDADGELAPVIGQWMKAHASEFAWIAQLSRVGETSIPEMPREDSWRLYALSRVSDALIS
jgi:hypothetical protein